MAAALLSIAAMGVQLATEHLSTYVITSNLYSALCTLFSLFPFSYVLSAASIARWPISRR